jgi:phosphoribosylformylglycinamidine synthase
VHDVSDGGLGVALAEMAVRGVVGFTVAGISGHHELFGEGPSRVLLCVEPAGLRAVLERADAARVPAQVLGDAVGQRLVVDGLLDLPLEEVSDRWAGELPAVLAGAAR